MLHFENFSVKFNFTLKRKEKFRLSKYSNVNFINHMTSRVGLHTAEKTTPQKKKTGVNVYY